MNLNYGFYFLTLGDNTITMKKGKSILFFILSAIFVACFFSTCKNDKGTPDYNQFPDDVGKIIFTKCATPGCHTDASKVGAAGLSMESWDKLFEGGTGSACVIPYRSDYSTFCYYTNTYSDLGVTLEPTMPYFIIIFNWYLMKI